MEKVDLKEELAIQAAAVEENNNAVKLTKNMSIQDNGNWSIFMGFSEL